MSRFEGAYDGEVVMPYHLWMAAFDRAVVSPRGQKLLREMEQALLALPEHKLIHGEIVRYRPWMHEEGTFDQAGVCAVGAYAAYRSMQVNNITWEQALEGLADGWGGERDCWETQDLGVAWGMAKTIAWELASLNDENLGHLTPEERWEAVLAWVRGKIKQEA